MIKITLVRIMDIFKRVRANVREMNLFIDRTVIKRAKLTCHSFHSDDPSLWQP